MEDGPGDAAVAGLQAAEKAMAVANSKLLFPVLLYIWRPNEHRVGV